MLTRRKIALGLTLTCSLAMTLVFQNCTGFSPNAAALSNSFSSVTAPAAVSAPAPVMPLGISGSFTPIINATFGNQRADSTVQNRSDLDKLAYYWFEYGASDTDPAYFAQSVAPNNCRGPQADGADGLYYNYVARHMHCDEGSTWDRHVMKVDRLTLKANCGFTDNDPTNCAAPNVASGILRFVTSFRPTVGHPVVIELRAIMPKGMYSWPAFWLNPGEQAPRNADGSPGKLLSSGWPPEIDLFDQFGYDGILPGHYLYSGTPTGGNDLPYASPLCASQNSSLCDLPITPGGSNLPTTSVASFTNGSDHFTTVADLTADFHTYGAVVYTDHYDVLLDGVIYRSRGFMWPASSPPMQLLISNQIGAYFRDLSGLKDQGGVPNGWDWDISHVRVWQQN